VEIPWTRRSERDAWEAMRGLSAADYRTIKTTLRERGLEGTPQYAAWLRTELTKAAMRKRAALATSTQTAAA
jgi:hypothetical protein